MPVRLLVDEAARDDRAAALERRAELLQLLRLQPELGLEPGCGSCHVLEDAGTTGTVRPNLDDLQPDAERVAQAVRTGPGAMPSYEGQLSDEQIENVAAYVSEASAGG